MKKISIIILLAFAYFTILAQERVDENLPIISKRLATINQAIGWQKNDIGKWVSLKKSIPYTSHDMNFAQESFIEYKLFKIKIEGNDYTTLVKTEQLGFTFWVFDTTLSIEKNDTTYSVNKPLLVSGRNNYRYSEPKLLTEIKAELKELENENSQFIYSFNISFSYFPSKKLYRFYFGPAATLSNEETNVLQNKYYETSDPQCQIFFKELY